MTAAGTTPVVVPDSGLIDVPPEATAQALGVESPGMIVFSGVTAGVQRITCNLLYLVSDHAPIDGTAPDPTPDQWAQFVAMVQQYAQQASQSATEAAGSATAAASSATASAASAKQAKDAAASVSGAVEAVESARDGALKEISSAKDTAVQALQAEANTGVSSVEAAATKAASGITSSGTAALEAIGQTEQAAIGQVQQAGQAQLDKINAANALVPTPTQADAGKAIIVKPDGSGYALGEVQTDAYTKSESDARYAPIAAAIRPTVSGNPATLDHSVAWAMQGLNVYGKSTQDGTPSPDNPVPIVSAGDAGSIHVTVSNGADQSQQLIIPTPNGLPGIPVDSGGTYTDASGKQWVCDEVNDSKRVHRIEQIEFDGSPDESWGMGFSENAQRNYFFITLKKNGAAQ